MSPMTHQTLIESLQELIVDFMKHTSTDIKLIVEGEATKVGDRIKFAIIRCIQEGLTNAKNMGRLPLLM